MYQVLFPREAKPATQLHVEADLGMRGAICPLYTPVHRHCIHKNNFAFPLYNTELPVPQYCMNKHTLEIQVSVIFYVTPCIVVHLIYWPTMHYKIAVLYLIKFICLSVYWKSVMERNVLHINGGTQAARCEAAHI